MLTFESISKTQEFSLSLRRKGIKIALVPTMGFLHEGHMSLVKMARMHADFVMLSIFVNPTQFGPNEDFSKYPRDFEGDSELCLKHGVDLIFHPDADEMYPDLSSTWVEETILSKPLCGKSRPTHFRGVCTVVVKLFNATLPDIAIFGEKDYQQAAVIKRMVRDLNFPVKILSVPIVREHDGLAMSSRNKYLSPDERQNALAICKSLDEARKMAMEGELSSSLLAETVKLRISQAGGNIDYIEIVNSETLLPEESVSKNSLIAVAAYFGGTRLIDNCFLIHKNIEY